MFCPFCGSEDTSVVDKRDNRENGVTRRRRECIDCRKRFTTYERIERITLNVVKRSGNIEEFDREKLKVGLLKAVKKRRIPEDKIENLVVEIEQKLLNADQNEITTVEIGQLVLEGLAKIDKIGALLFAAVYKDFKSLDEVQIELNKLKKSG